MKIKLSMGNQVSCTANIADDAAYEVYGSLAEALLDNFNQRPKQENLSLNKSGVTEERPVRNKIYYFAKCEECGTLAFISNDFERLKNGEATLTCRECGHITEIESVWRSTCECPCCGYSSSVLLANDTKEAKCKECKSLVDILNPAEKIF